MGQPRAAAQRKLGFTARLYYLSFGILALIWFGVYSFGSIMGVIDATASRDVSFNLDGRINLQTFLLTFAGLCVVWFALTGTKYSVVKVPRIFPKLEGLAVILLIGYFLCRTDIQGLADFFQKEDFPFIFFFLIPIWAIMILSKINDGLGDPLQKVPSFLWHLILPVLIILTPFGDLTPNMHIAGEGFLVIGVPFLIFTLPVYYRLGLEYVKEHPEYRKMFIFGRGGAARWGGLYSFLKYDFNAFMNHNEVKYGPIYCGKTLWYDDVKLNGRSIGLDSDSMMLTVAAMGGGKSLFAAWNTLLSWRGGIFSIDPKGEHTERVYEVRSKFSAGHMLDPWGNVKHLYEGDIGATFNPLEEIDIHSPNARDDIFQIVESCIMQEADENANSKHFRENAQKIMTGVIAHVLSEYPEKDHNLPTIYDIILTGSPEGTISMPEAFNVFG